jgi:four helix bundle protein
MPNKLKELKIWEKSVDLAVSVYSSTAEFPNEEKYGLTSQIRRSAVSIPSNISEGAGRNSGKEFIQFLGIANGSSYELETQLILSSRLGLISGEVTEKLLNQIEEIQRMNYGLRESINQKQLK